VIFSTLEDILATDFEAAATVNKKTALYHQAGNSIPVPIFESLFKSILKDLGKEELIKEQVQLSLV